MVLRYDTELRKAAGLQKERIMGSSDGSVHPLVLQAHRELHSAAPFREAARLLEAGQMAAALPPAQRSSLKNQVDQSLLQFHDLGLQQVMTGRYGSRDEAWGAFNATEGAAWRHKIETQFSKLADECRKQYRDAETKWKQTPERDPQKQPLAQKMNHARQNMSKIQALDKVSFVAKLTELWRECFALGWDRGRPIALANERRRKHGMPLELVRVEVRLLSAQLTAGPDPLEAMEQQEAVRRPRPDTPPTSSNSGFLR